MTADNRYDALLPRRRGLFYGGRWHEPAGGHVPTFDPASGRSLGDSPNANADDVNAAVRAAHTAFAEWRRVTPLERGRLLRAFAQRLRDHAEELALVDALNAGSPVVEMRRDVAAAAAQIDYFAGLVTEAKGETIPMGEHIVNYTLREPFGVCARIVAYNHPLMFIAAKMAPALAAGNTVIMKPAPQAPLSALRLAELTDGILPPGVLNIVGAGRAGSQALVEHPLVPRVSLIGSVDSGRAIARAAADRLKHVSLELGGKNACVIFADADIERAADAAVRGMNFAWCGQSCGSTSRLFVHESVHERVLAIVQERIRHFVPGRPTDDATTMGALISREQRDKVLRHIEAARADGAVLACGGGAPDNPALRDGFFVEPTVFTGVTQSMRLANDEVFGPVLAVLAWRDVDTMIEQVNAVPYGLTASIWTSGLAQAHRSAARIQAGFVWVNQIGAHFIGAPFGGYKQSGIGREEGLDELLSFTQVKNVHINF